jgi:putative transcriptional regulator
MAKTKRPMKRKPRSKLKAAIHEAAEGLFKAGFIDKQTMHRFDASCLTTVTPLSAKEIRELRLRAKVSQTVFAQHLNVTTGLVSKWERGEKRPAGPSLKLLSLVASKGLSAIA